MIRNLLRVYNNFVGRVFKLINFKENVINKLNFVMQLHFCYSANKSMSGNVLSIY